MDCKGPRLDPTSERFRARSRDSSFVVVRQVSQPEVNPECTQATSAPLQLSRSHQRRDTEQVHPKPRNALAFVLTRQRKALKGAQQVLRQKHQLHIHIVTLEVVAGEFVQERPHARLFDPVFHCALFILTKSGKPTQHTAPSG